MILRKSHLLLIAGIAVSLASCKKDDDSEALPYLSGSLSFDLPEYITSDDETEYKMIPSGVTHPAGGGIGYKWKVSPSQSSDYITTKEENAEGDGHFTYNFREYNKDTLRTITVSCSAFASGYNSTSVSKYVTVVSTGKNGSIQNAGYDFDSQDRIEYAGTGYLTFTGADGKTWMKQNLAYKGDDAQNPIGTAYRNSEAMSDLFGRFYTWNEATKGETASGNGHIRGICPEGWHIPTDAEWTALANRTLGLTEEDEFKPVNGFYPAWSRDGMKISREFMAGTTDLTEDEGKYGKEAKSATFNTDTEFWKFNPDVGDPTNKSGLSALSIGYAQKSNGKWSFNGVYEYAIFWTADKDESGKALCRTISSNSPDILIESHDANSFAASVRCVKD